MGLRVLARLPFVRFFFAFDLLLSIVLVARAFSLNRIPFKLYSLLLDLNAIDWLWFLCDCTIGPRLFGKILLFF